MSCVFNSARSRIWLIWTAVGFPNIYVPPIHSGRRGRGCYLECVAGRYGDSLFQTSGAVHTLRPHPGDTDKQSHPSKCRRHPLQCWLLRPRNGEAGNPNPGLKQQTRCPVCEFFVFLPLRQILVVRFAVICVSVNNRQGLKCVPQFQRWGHHNLRKLKPRKVRFGARRLPPSPSGIVDVPRTA